MPSELLSRFAPSPSRGWPPTAPRREPRVIAEELFRVVLKHERKRAGRCNQPFVLLIVAVDGQPAPGSSFIWKPVIETLGALIRETDIMGWLARRATIGVVLTDARTNVKRGIADPYLRAQYAIVDPVFTHSLPPSLTAYPVSMLWHRRSLR